jgi:hypothetical protein
MAKRHTFSVQGLKAALVLTLVALLAPAVRAGDGVNQTAINRARAFLDAGQRGREIVSCVHFGTKYRGHFYTERRGVTNSGNPVPGHFALVYRLSWADDGESDVAFFCDAAGSLYDVQVLKTNAVLNQPWLAGDLAIKALGNVLLEAFRNNLSQAQRDDVQRIINNASARDLLKWSLRFQQGAGL